jgi:hypothetical protein
LASRSAPGVKVESFERYPSRVPAAPQDFQHRLEVVVSGAAVAAVQLVHVDVADVVEVALHQRGVRQFSSMALCTSNMVWMYGLPISRTMATASSSV